eukprot:251422-Heterocapsa_arctica.AAC.1
MEEHIKATEALEVCQQEYQEVYIAPPPTAAPETPRPNKDEAQEVNKRKPWGNRRAIPIVQPAKGGIDDEDDVDLDHLQ